MPSDAAGSGSDFTRLHITPLDPDLLKIILPASVASQARNISYHTVETFPERRYGFVELPIMDAEKLKKKLNGTVLKGTKVRVEKARPEQRVEPTGDVDEEPPKRKKSKRDDGIEGSKKRKRDPDLVEGVALTDRKVKRGWTESGEHKTKKSKKDKKAKSKHKDKDGDDEEEIQPGEKLTEKKKRIKSKYTEKEECLLKTKVPPNRVADIPVDSLPHKKKRKGKSQEVVVHEFEKTTKFMSFLKEAAPETASKAATEFVKGKGWVDEDGNVVETVKSKAPSTPAPKKSKEKKTKREPTPVVEEDDDTSSSGTSSSGSSSDEDSDDEAQEPESDTASPTHALHATPLSAIKADSSRPMSSSSARSLTIKIPPPITPSTTKVHPLEALYKRPRGDATPAAQDDSQPFTFFGDNDDDDIEEDAPQASQQPPMTPFTRQDLEWRNVRSAAPTPDTAHPSRMRNFWAEDEGDEDEEEEPYDMDDEGEGKPQPGSSDFQAWFWENRRDLNRSWMRRRKTAAKEKRHRENKARASRAV